MRAQKGALKRSWWDAVILKTAICCDKISQVAKKAFIKPYKVAPAFTIYTLMGATVAATFFLGASAASIIMTGSLALGLPLAIAGTTLKWSMAFAAGMQGIAYTGNLISHGRDLLKSHKHQTLATASA